MEKTELLACPFCGNSAIVVEIGGGHFYKVKCRNIMECGAETERFDDEEEAAQAWNRRTPSPDNMKTALLPLEFVFGHGAFGVGSVSEDESAPIREIIVYRLPNPVLPAGTTLGDKGKHVEELENVLVRMRFESVESAHVFERSVSRVLDSFGETDNCTNAECPYQHGVPCPAADGCGWFVPDNKPLTAEELREMDGEPVYMVDLTGGTLWTQWVIFSSHSDYGFAPRGGGWFSIENYEKTWVCYRQPPEKGE